MRFPVFTKTRDISAFDNLSAFDNFFHEFKPLVDSSLFCHDTRVMMPAINISEDNEAFHIEVEAALMRKQDFKISVEKNTLIISGERQDKQEKKDTTYYRKEIVSGSFSRSFVIPENVPIDGISANFENGVLHVSLLKSEPTPEQIQNIEIA